MLFRFTALSAAAMAASLSTLSPAALAAVQESSASRDAAAVSPHGGASVQASLKLDFKQLSAMKAGQQIDMSFPVVGRKTVIFEALTTGLDGSRYWHGRLKDNAGDRVYLKQAGKGLVTGALRLGSRQIAFKQSADRALHAAKAAAPVAGRAYALVPGGSKGEHEIHGQFAALSDTSEGSEIALPLPGGQTEIAVVTRAALDEDGFFQIQGVSRMDGHGAPTVITVGTDGVFGTVYSSGREYQIVTRGGKTVLLDPDGAGLSHLRGDDQLTHDDHAGEAVLQTGAALTARAGTTTIAATTAQPVPLAAGQIDTTITLLMSYGPGYVSLWGTEALARTRLSNIVQVANAAYANSGTGIQFRIVGWSLVNQGNATPQTILPALRAGTGVFSGLPAIKRANGAAITVFFSPFNAVTSATSTCGLAYIPGASAAGLAAFKAQAPGAMFAALNDGQNNGYYCETLSLAHELGHNLGNVHDKASSSFAGVFNYSYGKGVAGSFGTIMSYVSPRVALFSSPQLTCGASKAPCGTSTENVVATMLQTKSTVAALGIPAKVSVATTGATLVSGWLVNANGSPYTGAASVKAGQLGVTCSTGSTGLYVCRVPDGVANLTVTVTASGKVSAPAMGSFGVPRDANMPVNGTRFYLSDAPKTAAALIRK